MTVASASVYAVIVQATSAYVASNSVWKVGSATLTTVMSRIDMMAPSTTTPAILRTAPSIRSDDEMACCWVTTTPPGRPAGPPPDLGLRRHRSKPGGPGPPHYRP